MSGGATFTFTRLALCDVLADAIKASAERANARECYELAALSFRQIGVAFPPPTEQGGDADAGRMLALVEAEQERFLERLGKKRADWRKWKNLKGFRTESARNPHGIQEERGPTISTSSTTSDNTLREGAQSAQARETSPAESAKGGKTKRPTMQPPTADEVRAYAEAQGLAIDAERFVDYYKAQGWKLSNGQAMKDWEATARNWARRDSLRPTEKKAAITDTGRNDGGRFDGLF